MFEPITYEELVKRMMERALAYNKNLDSREGSLLFLAEAPAAVELQNLYIALDVVLNETFADTANRQYLIQRAKERGLFPNPATAAVLQLSITPTTLPLKMGKRFSIGELNYYVSENKGGGNYAITCETLGEAGNESAGTVIPIEYVEGLETCTVTALLIPGEDEEETEHFRQRYFDSLTAQAFGGNRADYISKVNKIPGIGGVRVYREWNGDIRPAELVPPDEAQKWMNELSGVPAPVLNWLKTVFTAAKEKKLTVGGTVRLVILDSTFSSPSDTLVELAQTVIDPEQNAGEGYGTAPIGHVVKVEGAKEEWINLSFSLAYQAGFDWAAVEAGIQNQINEYFKELAKTWAKLDTGLVVRIAQIESRILDVNGVLDISGTKINGKTANYTVSDDCLPVLGAISAGTAG